jgi:hypothetical protein
MATVSEFKMRPGSALPIVGQPFTLKDWFLQLLVTCNCSSRPEPLLIIGQVGATSTCSACGRHFVLQAIVPDAAGQLQLSIGMSAPSQGEPA